MRALNETTVFDQIEVEMRPDEATFRTRCSNRALVTRFRSRYYLLQIIVLSIKDERKKNVKVQRNPRKVLHTRVSWKITLQEQSRCVGNMIYVGINTKLTKIKMQRITHVYCSCRGSRGGGECHRGGHG